MLDETQARLTFGNIKYFSYLNSTFAPVRQLNASKGYRGLTHFILSQIFYTGKNLFRRTQGWDINSFPDILLLMFDFIVVCKYVTNLI